MYASSLPTSGKSRSGEPKTKVEDTSLLNSVKAIVLEMKLNNAYLSIISSEEIKHEDLER